MTTVTKQDNLHLFTTCHRIQNIGKHFQPTYQKLIKKQHTPDQPILTLSSNNTNSKCKKLTLTLTQIIIYEIWQSRNNLKYDKTQLTQQTIINKIIAQLTTILNAHYKFHRLNDMLNQFQELFCINNAIVRQQPAKNTANINKNKR